MILFSVDTKAILYDYKIMAYIPKRYLKIPKYLKIHKNGH